WLRDVRVKTGRLRVGTEVVFLVRSHGDNGNILESFLFADQLCCFKAVHEWKREVHQNYVGVLANRSLDRDMAVFGFQNDEALLFKLEAHEETRVFKVFDEENFQIP